MEASPNITVILLHPQKFPAWLFSPPAGRVHLCPRQTLLPGHLTVRESLTLMAALWGLPTTSPSEHSFVESELAGLMDRPLSRLPRGIARTLNWLLALLPDPEHLLILDLAAGLGHAARHHLWGLIRKTQHRAPRTLYYLTHDIEAARTLADEVWCFQNKNIQPRWPARLAPPPLMSAAGFTIELNTPSAARRFAEKAARIKGIENIRLYPPRSVDVLADDARKIIDLTWLAGFELAGFQSRAITLEEVWDEPHPIPAEDTPTPAWPPPLTQKTPLTLAGHANAIIHLALAEWRTHFRSFWKAGNLLLTGIILLTGIQALLSLARTTADFLYWMPIALLLVAALPIGLGVESINQLKAAGATATLFRPAQPLGPTRPVSRLAFFDTTPAGRGTVLAGILLGQAFVWGAHSWPLALLLGGIQAALPHIPWLIPASVLFWLLAGATSLFLMALLGCWAPRLRWGWWAGWPAWLLAVLSGHFLAGMASPLAWLWPFAGFTAAFRALDAGAAAWPPLAAALTGSALLGLLALRRFRRQPAIWQPATNPQ